MMLLEYPASRIKVVSFRTLQGYFGGADRIIKLCQSFNHLPTRLEEEPFLFMGFFNNQFIRFL
jgi:hypothetical protein